MNAAQIHLALNHVPLIVSVTGGILLLLGMIRKNESVKIASLYLLVAAALFSLPVFFSGEGTEEMVEKLPGVSEVYIEDHEEMAKSAFVIIIITGIMALTGILLRKKAAIARFAMIASLLLAFASFAAMAQTAHLGGLIRHSELRTGTVVNGASENGQQHKGATVEQEKKDKEDDD